MDLQPPHELKREPLQELLPTDSSVEPNRLRAHDELGVGAYTSSDAAADPTDAQTGKLGMAEPEEAPKAAVAPISASPKAPSPIAVGPAGSFPPELRCVLCGESDDAGACDRLMFVEPGCWVHLNCALWSSEVSEDMGGALLKFGSTLLHSKKQLCAHCGKPGASIGCNNGRCKRIFHFGCLKAADALILADRRAWCSEHRVCKAATRGKPLQPHLFTSRALMVNPPRKWLSDEANAPKAALVPRHWSCSKNATLPPGQWLRAGALTVVNPGVPPSVEGEAPPGYVAWRRHWSTVHPMASCGYELRVLPVDDAQRAEKLLEKAEEDASGGGEVGRRAGVDDLGQVSSECGKAIRFRITPEDEPENPIEASSALAAVEQLYSRLRSCQPSLKEAASLYPTAPSYPFSAAFFFGWVLEPVQRSLHGLAGERRGKVEADEMPRNAAGCARAEGVSWRRGEAVADQRRPSKRQHGERASDRASSLAHVEKTTSYLQRDVLPPGNVEKLRNLNSNARTRFKVKRSNIHGMGLFVKEFTPKGEMLIEYQGKSHTPFPPSVAPHSACMSHPRLLFSRRFTIRRFCLISQPGSLIRSSLSERLNLRYKTIGDYIFRIDETTHVDATVAGNMARFMNHSCAPNCYSRVLEVGRMLGASGCSLDKHIVIYAARDLQVGEELQYDYQFTLGGDKIECRCGAPNCWGRMN